MRQLDDEGYAVTFMGSYWEVTKWAIVVTRGKKTCTLYITTNTRNSTAIVDAEEDSNLWYHGLGHMSEKGMKALMFKGKLSGIKSMDIDLCEDCIFGKHKMSVSQRLV